MSPKVQSLRHSFVCWYGFQACGAQPNFPESPFSRVYMNNPKRDSIAGKLDMVYQEPSLMVVAAKCVNFVSLTTLSAQLLLQHLRL